MGILAALEGMCRVYIGNKKIPGRPMPEPNDFNLTCQFRVESSRFWVEVWVVELVVADEWCVLPRSLPKP